MRDERKQANQGGRAGNGSALRLALTIGVPLAVLVLLPGGLNGWVLVAGVVVSALVVGLAGAR